jgi:hypothetical protein
MRFTACSGSSSRNPFLGRRLVLLNGQSFGSGRRGQDDSGQAWLELFGGGCCPVLWDRG